MKKLLLALGSVASIAAPVATVVACSDSAATSSFEFKIDGVDAGSIKDFGHDLFKDGKIKEGMVLAIVVDEKDMPYTVLANDVSSWSESVSSTGGQTDFFKDLGEKANLTSVQVTSLVEDVKNAIAGFPSHK